MPTGNCSGIDQMLTASYLTRKSPKKPMKNVAKLLQDGWLRRQLTMAVVKGPAGLVFVASVALAIAFFFWDVGGHSRHKAMALVPLIVLLCGAFIAFDVFRLSRQNGLELLRRVARGNQAQLERIGVDFPPLSDFLRSPCDRPRGGVGELRLLVEALDRLTRTALRYGTCGRGVFERNLEPISIAFCLWRALPEENNRSFLNRSLACWLQEVPDYDPEGWSGRSKPRQLA